MDHWAPLVVCATLHCSNANRNHRLHNTAGEFRHAHDVLYTCIVYVQLYMYMKLNMRTGMFYDMASTDGISIHKIP